ncbi:hypothetical protein DFH06DRAFT_1238213 [Mycena polygramma]|nr:hypothetical protein DFH06DRAFT_1238213 [Mycena polygramma]
MRLLLLHIACIATLLIGAAATDAKAGDSEPLALHAEKETNADRFRRGLGPLPPTRRVSDHRELRVDPRPSSQPCTRLSNNVGTLRIRRLSTGKDIGYLSARSNHEKAYTVGGRRLALLVAVPPTTPFGAAINLIAANPEDSRYPFLGAVENGHGNLGPGEAGVAILAGVASAVRSGGTPSSTAGTSLTLAGHGGIETQIWTMNCQTRQITAQWTNPDGSHPRSTIIFFDPDREFLGLTGDLGASKAAVSDRIFPVTMIFVPE